MALDFSKTQQCASCIPYYQLLVPSESQPNTFYTITVPFANAPREEWACTCPGWTFRGYCKHLDTVAPCWWSEDEGPETQTADQQENFICPRCGQETMEEWT